MKKIIVGSNAAQKYSLSRRTPSDLDIWCEKHIPKEKGVDVKVLPKEILDLVEVDPEGYALPDSLFTMQQIMKIYPTLTQRMNFQI